MAQLLETLRSRASDSIKGRKLGLDLVDATLIGPRDIKRQVQDVSSASTAGTAISNFGIVVCRMSGSMTTATQPSFILSNPIPGVAVDICYTGTSDAATLGSTAVAFQRGSTAFYLKSTIGTTGVALLLAQGQAVRLLGISTDAYSVQGMGSSAALSPSITGTS